MVYLLHLQNWLNLQLLNTPEIRVHNPKYDVEAIQQLNRNFVALKTQVDQYYLLDLDMAKDMAKVEQSLVAFFLEVGQDKITEQFTFGMEALYSGWVSYDGKESFYWKLEPLYKPKLESYLTGNEVVREIAKRYL